MPLEKDIVVKMLLELLHCYEAAVPAVVPDLARVAVDAEHAIDRPVFEHVDGIVSVE